MLTLQFNRRLFVIAIVFCVFFVSFRTHAQYYTNQNKVWVFGNGSGVDFNSGVPIAIHSNINATEGGSSVCDTSGNLLFYSDGHTVWNSLGNIMPSGGAIVPYYTTSTTQSSVIMPVLAEGGRYYLFSLENWIGSGRLSYSVVDMFLDGGLGDVDTLHRGILIRSGLTEKMICVPGNNCNFWLVVHDADSAQFLSYEVSAMGINTTPVVSPVGYADYNGAGVAKVSHNRHKLACMFRSFTPSAESRAELYDFDPCTGIVSNAKVLNTYLFSYGAEFSPDDTKLYTFHALGQIYQYDITSATTADIIASEYLVKSSTDPATYGSDLRLAPDGKIYLGCMGPSSKNYLDCISSPNLAGAACGYVDSAVNLTPGQIWLGITNLFWSIFIPPITGPSHVCVGAHVTMLTECTGGTWMSTAPSIAAINPATGVVTGISAGTTTISYALSCGISTATITVNPSPTAITADTFNLNPGTTVTLHDPTPGGTWSSSDNAVAAVDSASGVATGITAGTSIITYTAPNGCYVTDTIEVNWPSGISNYTSRTVLVYPNPVTDRLSIEIPEWQSVSVSVLDIVGRCAKCFSAAPVNNLLSMDASDLPDGCYLVKMSIGDRVYRGRFVKGAK